MGSDLNNLEEKKVEVIKNEQNEEVKADKPEEV